MWEQRESNPRPSACKADALNQLSYAPFFSFLFANYCVKLHSGDSHVAKYAPVFSFVFLVLDKNKLRNVYLSSPHLPNMRQTSFRRQSRSKVRSCLFIRLLVLDKELPLSGLQMYAIFLILQNKSDRPHSALKF